MNISEFLFHVRARPQLFVQERRMTLLEPLIQGFLIGVGNSKVDSAVIADFHDMLNKNPQIKPHPFYSNQLIQIAGSDEAAFTLFFEMFDEFVKTGNYGIPSLTDLT